MYCLMSCYSIQICTWDILQPSYCYTIDACDYNKDSVNRTSASKPVYLSIINAHYLLHFIGAIIFICMVTIPIENSVNIIYATMDE